MEALTRLYACVKIKFSMVRRFLSVFIIFSLALVPFLFNEIKKVEAAALVNLSDTLTRLDNSTLSSHDILFDLPAAETFDAGQTIAYDFNEDGSDWAVDGASSAVADFDFTTAKSTSTVEAVILAVDVGAPDCTGESGANDVAIGINDTTGVVTVEACSTFTSTDAASTINLEYGTAAGGTDRVTNPAGTGSTVLAVNHASGTNTGSLAVPILSDDQVTVSASVDPTISSTLSATTCTLGTLSTSTIETCTYDNDVVTNATSGYAATILEDGELRTSGGDDIDQADGDVVQGTEEYGVGTSQAGQTITQNATCPDPESDPAPASAITGTAQQYGGNSGPTNGDTISLCHAASIAGVTPAGSYQHIVTHITTGTF